MSHENQSLGSPTRVCTSTEDGQRLEIISDLGSRHVEGLRFLCSKNKGANQLRGYHEADLLLCFRICKRQVFI